MVEESNDNEYAEEPVDDEEVDPELLDLASSKRPQSILRPILFGVVIWVGVSIIGDWQTPLAYFFSSSEPVEIGSVTEFAAKRAQDPDWETPIPHNHYVSLEGVPSRRAQSERYRFFKLVGGHVYIQVARDNADESALEREFDKEEGDIDRTMFEGAGRALDLSQSPDQYQGLKKYYFERYRTYFCGMQLSDKAKAAVADQPCVDAHVVEIGVEPTDHWWYVALSGLIGIFILLNIWWLIRWVRDFIRH